MNLRDLEYFLAIAQLGSLAKAAEQCHVSQATISIQLKKLEEFLEIPLFERANKRMAITKEGLAVLPLAQQAVQSAKRIKQTALEIKNPFTAEFKLGVFPTLAPYLLPKIVPAITAHFPKLTLLLFEEKTPVLLDKLEQGFLDAALLALPIAHTNLETVFLFNDPFLLACHRSHPLARRKKATMEDLEKQTLLLLEEGHCLRDQALAVCRLVDAKETKSFRATSLETLRQMVAANVGITLIPAIAATHNPHIAYIPFSGKNKPSRDIALVYRKTAPGQRLLAELGKLLGRVAYR